jgi:hypothetical protein
MNYELTKYDDARRALAICASVDEVKDIADKSEAMRLYAKMSENSELEILASTIKLRAQVKLGEMIAGMERVDVETQFGGRPSGGKPTKTETLAAAGISKSSANRYEHLAAVPESVLETYIAEKKEAQKPVSMAQVMSVVKPKIVRSPKPEATPKPTPVVIEVKAEPEEENPGQFVTVPSFVFEEMEVAMREVDAIRSTLDPDDLHAANEIKMLTLTNEALKSDLLGAQNRENELKRIIKSRDREIAKLKAELDKDVVKTRGGMPI